MNFISMAIANILNFISERIPALGVTTKFICLSVIALFVLDIISARCYNDFFPNSTSAIMNWKRDIKLIVVHILADLVALYIVTFILCRISFTFCCGLPVIVPISITISIIAGTAVLITQDMSSFVCTFRTRYILPIV